MNERAQIQHVETDEVIGTMTVPWMEKQRALGVLREMQLNGEIAYAFNPIEVERDGVRLWEVEYVRIRHPRGKLPRMAAATATVMGAFVGIGVLAYESRWVLLWIGVGITVVVVGAILAGTRAGGGGACSGVHVKH